MSEKDFSTICRENSKILWRVAPFREPPLIKRVNGCPASEFLRDIDADQGYEWIDNPAEGLVKALMSAWVSLGLHKHRLFDVNMIRWLLDHLVTGWIMSWHQNAQATHFGRVRYLSAFIVEDMLELHDDLLAILKRAEKSWRLADATFLLSLMGVAGVMNADQCERLARLINQDHVETLHLVSLGRGDSSMPSVEAVARLRLLARRNHPRALFYLASNNIEPVLGFEINCPKTEDIARAALLGDRLAKGAVLRVQQAAGWHSKVQWSRRGDEEVPEYSIDDDDLLCFAMDLREDRVFGKLARKLIDERYGKN